MATPSALLTRQTRRAYFYVQRCFSGRSTSTVGSRRAVHVLTAGACGISVATAGYWLLKDKKWLVQTPIVQLQAREIPSKAESEEAEDLSLYPLSDKEYRFQSFASCEFNGQIYMTPQDFLESVTEENPRRKSLCPKLILPGTQTLLDLSCSKNWFLSCDQDLQHVDQISGPGSKSTQSSNFCNTMKHDLLWSSLETGQWIVIWAFKKQTNKQIQCH
ncbi:uncharacterized protein [Diadema antillarum]|uniref:uncharacterized protein n=1 Tax=Diadema antillarum TaxID=105358 RepID=UPI003A843B04